MPIYLSVELLWVQKSFGGKQSRAKMTPQEMSKVQKPAGSCGGGGDGHLVWTGTIMQVGMATFVVSDG